MVSLLTPLQGNPALPQDKSCSQDRLPEQARKQEKVLVSGFVRHFLLQSFDEIRDGLSIASQ
jgi:hypothetical protein